jgi:hypothetical protein
LRGGASFANRIRIGVFGWRHFGRHGIGLRGERLAERRELLIP